MTKVTSPQTMTLDDLAFAANTHRGNSERSLTDGQLVAAALFKVAEAIEGVGHKLERYLPDRPDHINEDVATALDGIAAAIRNANDLESAKHPEAAAIVAENDRKQFG